MRKLILLLFLLVSVIAEGRKIPESESAAIASKFFNSTPSLQQQRPKVQRVRKRDAQKEESAPYYVYNADGDKGFVIISGDDRAKKILGYSDKGSFDFENLPPQLSAMLDEYAAQLSLLSDNGKTDKSWSQDVSAHSSEDGILLETANWGQDYPYNVLCPIKDGVQAPAGCVATAMAIVMKYHNWPENGRNKWTFRHAGISVDFSQSHYNFGAYLNQYEPDTELTPDVRNMAQLIHDAGLALNTYYTKNASSANPVLMGYLLMRFFRYSPECHNLIRKDYTDSQWKAFINDNLNKRLPIVYSEANYEVGHTFVIDGYKGDLYHVNWGWDGRLNGYFALEALNPSGLENASYDYEQSMIVNIKPDYASQEFSEVWLDSGDDRGYDWQPEWAQQLLRGMGMGIDCEEIISGEPFSLLTEVLSAPVSFGGEIGIALMKGDNQIVDILRTVEILAVDESPDLGVAPYWYLFNAHEWKDLVYDGPISSDMYVQLVSRRNDEQEWKIINGTEQTPSRLPVKGNTPTVLRAEVTYHVDPEFSDMVKFESGVSRIGQGLPFSLSCRFGVAHLYYDDIYMKTVSEFGFRSSDYSNNFLIRKPTGKVDIYYIPQNKLLHRSIDVAEPGTLSSHFAGQDTINTYKLKINRKINDEDLLFLRKFKALRELDLSDASIDGNELSVGVPNVLGVLNLPKGLEKVTWSDFYGDYNPLILNVPKSVTDCGVLRARGFMVFNSSTPPSADYEGIRRVVEGFFGTCKVPTVLIVPKGSKAAYQQHPHWKHFEDIVEMNEDEYFDASFRTHENMMYCTITNKLGSLTNDFIGDDEGMTFFPGDDYERPYQYIKLPLHINDCQKFFIQTMLDRSLGGFNGGEIYFIPSEGTLIGSWFGSGIIHENEERCAVLDYFISPLLQPNFYRIMGRALVPAHSAIGEHPDKKDNKGNSFWGRYEMFGLNCDKKSNTVSIAATIDGINIEKVLINGKESLPVDTRYSADFSQDVEIEVMYNFRNNITMTTVYTPDFIAKLPHNPDNVTGMIELPDLNDLQISV